MRAIAWHSTRVETPIRGVLTPAAGQSKTHCALDGFFMLCAAVQNARSASIGQAACRSQDQGDIAVGAVATRGQCFGAMAPAAVGDLDAT